MSHIKDDIEASGNLEEFRQLRELVRTLEIQNRQLRNKQNISRRRSMSPVKDLKSAPKNDRSNKQNPDVEQNFDSNSNAENTSMSGNKDEYFDDLEIIRVSDIELSDDESWLYTPPKSKLDQKDENPYERLRQDLDDPEQFPRAKKALLLKLNELEMYRREVSSHNVENPMITTLRRSQVICKSPLSAQNYDPAHIDSRTFTRSKKKQAIEMLEKLDFLNKEKSEKISTSARLYRRGSDVSSDSVAYYHILEDANDVEEVARMQEESLRMGSPLDTPKRGSGSSLSSRKISTSSKGSISDQDVSEVSVFGAQTPDDSPSYECIATISSPAETLNLSDQSPPSQSPYGSNGSLHNAGKAKVDAYRQSLPNLHRGPLALSQPKRHVYSDNKVTSQVKEFVARGCDSRTSAMKRSGKEVHSFSRIKKTNPMPLPQSSFSSPENIEPANILHKSADSTHMRMLGQSQSRLPRPSRASSASRTGARAGIPMPSILKKKRFEDSWSEGCF